MRSTGRWQVVRLSDGGGARVRCRHHTPARADWCRAVRQVFRNLFDPRDRYTYDVRLDTTPREVRTRS